MPRFSETWAARQPQLDAVFAEAVRLVPLRQDGYAEATPDPDRAEQQVLAIVTERPDRKRTVDNAVGRDFDRMFVIAVTAPMPKWQRITCHPCQSDTGHVGQHRRRIGFGLCGLLVRLSAQESAGLAIRRGRASHAPRPARVSLSLSSRSFP